MSHLFHLGRSNQDFHKKAFETAHRNDTRPSDARLVAAKEGETIDQFKQRLEANRFEIIDPKAHEDISESGIPRLNLLLPAQSGQSRFEELRKVAAIRGYTS